MALVLGATLMLTERNCYCKPDDSSCGSCERCGIAGHTRHYPGPVPYTGSWCDDCYAKLGTFRHDFWQWARIYVVPLLLLGIIVLTIFSLVRAIGDFR